MAEASPTEPLRDLARGHRILAMEGHEELILGHLSWRDPSGRGFWIKRHGIGMAEVWEPGDLILLAFDGERLDGTGNRHAEWPIHAEIYRARPDVASVAHTHAFHATAFSATAGPLRAVALPGTYFREDVPRYTDTAHLVDTPELGRAVAAALGNASAVLMRNHGVTFCGPSLDHCVSLGYFLERACRQQLVLEASGREWAGLTDEELRSKGPKLLTDATVALFWAHLNRKLDRYEAGLGVGTG